MLTEKDRYLILANRAYHQAATYLTNENDRSDLAYIMSQAINGEIEEAMAHASDCDTIIREAIPVMIWKLMGGELTKTGEKKLLQEKAEFAAYTDKDKV